ncbi:MAG: 30S ribosomal protein S7 [Elusimicrobia bacterium HGW-Elusimicrobia-2]|nr:30S ribosomal protein S7 [Elusimicrobiota bacterium]PKN00348.1 MAG: 30S ribosomal protein S7 [Elusimicrobia bacterium HGW-Elusimicrobia-2]
MSRKKIKIHTSRRRLPDIKYGSLMITLFINNIMKEGKKNAAMRIMYDALDEASKQLKVPQKDLLDKAVTNLRPQVEVKSRRVGGATYQIPQPVTDERGQDLAMRWILEAARKRKGAPMHKKLAMELIDAYKGEGSVMKKRENVHKMAEANKAFAHYRY